MFTRIGSIASVRRSASFFRHSDTRRRHSRTSRAGDWIDAWLAPYRRLWEGRLDALEQHLDDHPDREGT